MRQPDHCYAMQTQGTQNIEHVVQSCWQNEMNAQYSTTQLTCLYFLSSVFDLVQINTFLHIKKSWLGIPWCTLSIPCQASV